jgi:hypothetical protein
MINYIFLFIGIIYVTLLPGFVLTEFLLPKFSVWIKIPLYFLLSVIISSYFSYFTSLVFGFNRLTLIGCFTPFLILSVYLLIKRSFLFNIKENLIPLSVGVFVYVIFFVSLYPAIFKLYNGSYVIAGPNWQDTAMHLSIIESLTQGNFPPQAPYFSGQPLSYYYFSDLHAAIVNTFFGNYFPRILVVLNPFFAMVFFFAVYALCFELTRKKAYSAVAALASVFYGNLSFIIFFNKLLVSGQKFISFVADNTFHTDGNYFIVVPMADYFLQNRPMMVGLSALILVIILLRKKKILLAGLFTALLIKFQMFGFVVAWIFFGFYVLTGLFSKTVGIKNFLKNILIFAVPSFTLLLIFAPASSGGRNMFQIFIQNFSWGPWQKHELLWFVNFVILNLNILFPLFLLSFFSKKNYKDINLLPIYLTAFTVFAIPFLMRFTIYEFDMFKFFYYIIPLICILTALSFSRLRFKKISFVVFLMLSIPIIITSGILLTHSFLNKSVGYSQSDLSAGIWIRENVPQKSVFVTMPTVHSAVTDIGGRLRVISYINWPYSHGFNYGEDNVFSRVKDVTSVYRSGDVSLVKSKYNAKYVFVGPEELSQFPGTLKLLDRNQNLRKIYSLENIVIYEIF